MSLARLLPGLPTLALAAVLTSLAPGPLSAQVEAEARLEGRVVQNGEAVGEGDVVLHRVGRDTAGELDTLAVGADGTFGFLLPSVPGGSDEVYFASYRHQGILYFGPPIANAIQLDSAYVIEIHDTVAAPPGGADLPVAVRYMIVEPLQGGALQVTDLFQIRNDGERTYVAGEEGATWSYQLPPDIGEVQVGGGDVGPDASAVGGDGVLRIRAPIPPGERQFILRYAVPAPTLTIPLPGRTEHVELLVAEPAPNLAVEGLPVGERVEMAPGASYRRFVGEELSDAQVVLRMDPLEGDAAPGGARSAEESDSTFGRWLAVILAFLLAAIGLYAVMGPPRPAEARPGTPGRGGSGEGTSGAPDAGGAAEEGADAPRDRPSGDRRSALLLEIAAIDERLEAGAGGEAEARRLRERRVDLVARVREMDLDSGA